MTIEYYGRLEVNRQLASLERDLKITPPKGASEKERLAVIRDRVDRMKGASKSAPVARKTASGNSNSSGYGEEIERKLGLGNAVGARNVGNRLELHIMTPEQARRLEAERTRLYGGR